MTSNPTIFEQSISGSHDYDAPIRALAQRGQRPSEIYDAITIEDIQLAADEFRGVFDGLEQRDGFVSLEVSPHLANDAGRLVTELFADRESNPAPARRSEDFGQ
jgi:transaldolase